MQTHLFSIGVSHDLKNVLLWDYVEENADRRGLRTALVHTAGRMTFRELLLDANALARGLEVLGIQPGDTVSYQLPNWSETIVLVLALMRIGAVANPIVPIFRKREVEFILRQTGSKLFVVTPEYRGYDHLALARDVVSDLPTGIMICRGRANGIQDYDKLLRSYKGAVPASPQANPDADAFLIYTSGTVGQPKGVRHSQRTLITEVVSLRAVNHLEPTDIGLLPSPLTHITGILYGNLLPQIYGGTLCLMDEWDPVNAARIIEKERCTWLIGATPFLQGIVSNSDVRTHDLSSLRLVRCGGADVPPKLIRDAYSLGLTAVRSYGSTEFPGVSGVADQDPEKSATTDGKVHDHVDIRIVDPANGTKLVPFGEVGEIQTRGPELFLGYKDPALDADAFTEDHWYRSGDLGFLDEDRYLTIVGRLKDIIIRKGENISAKEVEDALLEHPSLASVAVIGVRDKDRGEMVVAVGVTAPGANFTMIDMKRHLDSCGLAKQKYPERLEIVDHLPMTAAGKIRKVELREFYAAEHARS
jgi:cyclohexanecarboxylate-CoA ligase